METIDLWARALLRRQGAVAAGGVLIFFSLVLLGLHGDRGMRVQAFPSALYTSMFRADPLVSLFPLVVAIRRVGVQWGAESPIRGVHADEGSTTGVPCCPVWC